MSFFWDADTILAALRDWAEEYGRPPLARDWWHADYGRPGFTTVIERFGSWNEALTAAGLPTRHSTRAAA